MTPPPAVILVVDDSPSVRRALSAIIEAEPGFRALEAADPYEAVERMRRVTPSAIVLDVDMPRMDGLTFLRKLMRQHPLPVLLVTDHPARGVEALELGAREVIAKPDWQLPTTLSAWAEHLRERLRLALSRGESRPAAEPRHAADAILPARPFAPSGAPSAPMIAVGASTGGVQAIARLLALLPRETPGVVIVQHMPSGFTAAFADRLGRDPAIAPEVREARHGDEVVPGVALIIPGHAHGVVRRSAGRYRIDLTDGPPVCRHRPSVEVLFRSVAQAAGPRAAGAILTGMLDDGAGTLGEIREAGGLTLAQDEATCTVFGMPREAIRRGGVVQVLPLDRIAGALTAWAARQR